MRRHRFRAHIDDKHRARRRQRREKPRTSPERRLSLLVHFPNPVVLDRKHGKPASKPNARAAQRSVSRPRATPTHPHHRRRRRRRRITIESRTRCHKIPLTPRARSSASRAIASPVPQRQRMDSNATFESRPARTSHRIAYLLSFSSSNGSGSRCGAMI